MKPVCFLLHLLALLLMLCSPYALSHKPSDSYLSLSTQGSQVTGQWDIALRDLEMAIGVDGNDDGKITWGEVRSKHVEIAAYALSRLELRVANQLCSAQPTGHQIDHHTDGAYAVLQFSATCTEPVDQLDIRYALLFDIDPQHRGLLRLHRGGSTVSAIFSPHNARQAFGVNDAADGMRAFIDYFKHGVWHIWIGFDHILFLVSLLLPAVLVYRNKEWASSESFRHSFIDVLKIVTAFTVAHSITLSIAALGIVQLPSSWVETAIAASVIVAAMNNLFPMFYRQRWVAAFAFGLIHGFGFASVLSELGLPGAALITALIGFNLGVEAGQIAIVAVFLPLAYFWRRSWAYRKIVFQAGSVAIALIALLWMIERVLDINLDPLALARASVGRA
jgi:hypothetical protein